MLNLNQKNKLVSLCLSVVVFILAFEILFYHSVITNWLCSIVEKAGVWSWIVVCILQILQVVFVPMPASFITLTSMKMYPKHLYLLFVVTLIAILVGVVLTYLIGRKWGKKAVVWCAGSEEEYNKWLTVLKSKKTNAFYFCTVLLPIFPDDVLCLLAGSIKMNFWWYLFSNVVGRAIGLASFMFFFKAIEHSIWSIVILFILTFVLIIFKIILKRRLKNESGDNRK